MRVALKTNLPNIRFHNAGRSLLAVFQNVSYSNQPTQCPTVIHMYIYLNRFWLEKKYIHIVQHLCRTFLFYFSNSDSLIIPIFAIKSQ